MIAPPELKSEQVLSEVNLIIDKLLWEKIDNEGMSTEVADKIKKVLIWTVIDGDVYDISNYVNDHPGGYKKIMRGDKKDST